jgi:hypothetical protein
MDDKMDVVAKLGTLVLKMDAEGTAFHQSNAEEAPGPSFEMLMAYVEGVQEGAGGLSGASSAMVAATPDSRALELKTMMDACGEQWKEILETQLARKAQADLEAQQQCEKDGKKKKGSKKKVAIVERTLACTKAAVTQTINISTDGGTMTCAEVIEQLQSQSAAYSSVQGPLECGSRASGKGTFTASGKQALNWEVRAREFDKYPLNGILQQQDLVVSEKRNSSSADFPVGSIEELWMKELGKMFELRMEQLRCDLTDERMLRLMKPNSLDAQLWPGRSAAVVPTQTELTELRSDVKAHLVVGSSSGCPAAQMS